VSDAPRRPALVLIPLIVFAGLAAIFWMGLSGTPSNVPSALIGRPVPEFALPAVEGLDVPGLKTADFKRGGVTVVKVWASWCGPCRDEHPLLMQLAKRSDLRLAGINNKDNPENARRFLGTLGNPFAAIGADRDGRVSIDWGAYGVPETFVVDAEGIIRFKFIGPLWPAAIEKTLLPEIAKAAKPIEAVKPSP
jgi:cytochrome c biogenesis protein CcmG/thiol:disulfide interchange protein DsbE